MAALQCEICGGKLIGRPGGVFECDCCGMEYDTAWAKAKIQEIKGTVKVEGTVEVKGTVQVDTSDSTQKLVRRMYILLQDRSFEKAKEMADQILTVDPENPEAYMGKLLARYSVTDKEGLKRLSWTFENSVEYKNVMRYGTEADKTLAKEANQAIAQRRKQEAADNALKSAESYLQKGEYEKAIAQFNEAASHHKVAEKVEKCKELINARDNFATIIDQACQPTAQQVSNAKAILEGYSSHAPSVKAAQFCREKLELMAGMQMPGGETLNSVQSRIAPLEQLRQTREQELSGLGFFGKKDRKQQLKEQIDRLSQELAPLYAQRERILQAQADRDRLLWDVNEKLRMLVTIAGLSKAKKGTKVTFGRYPYSSASDIQPLSWVVHEAGSTSVTLLCEKVIDCVPFGESSYSKVKWQDSNLYRWLKEDFTKSAFIAEERKYLQTVTAPKRDDLSWRDKYPAKPTPYARGKGITVDHASGNCNWYLQCDCPANYCPDYVYHSGNASSGFSMQGVIFHDVREGVRPMIRVNVDKIL